MLIYAVKYLLHEFKSNLAAAAFYRPQRIWAKVIFLQACVCPQGGCGLVPGGSSKFFWGVSKFSGGFPIFWGVSNFSGVFKFLGGLQFFGGLQIFGGSPNFWGGSSKFFFFFFSISFPPKKFFWDVPNPPDGQCSSGTHPTGMHSFFTNQT